MSAVDGGFVPGRCGYQGRVAAFGGWGRVVEQQAEGTKIEVSAESLEDLEDLYGELRGVPGTLRTWCLRRPNRENKGRSLTC
jgi:hypothetical protein